jgi:predicted AlkP superfamily pyrophosphatase or phosphodiesterase
MGRNDRHASRMNRFAAICFALLTMAWGRHAQADESPLILISLDGFRWDYTDLHPAESKTIRELKRDGVSAQSLLPVFPSNTFPNHYSIVTGLYPAHHGIVNNDFFDPTTDALFHFNQPAVVRNPMWWGGEPIWVTAVKQGRKAATAFWVGSDAEIAGVRPTFWQHFDYSVPFEKRLDELIAWLTLPVAERPALVTFYLEETNGAGHRFGPDSPQLVAAVKLLDERIAAMLARLRREHIEPNLLIVSDHGMTSTSLDRVIILEDHLDRSTVQIDSEGSTLGLRPLQGDATVIFRAFEKVAHVKVYRVEDLPAYFNFRDNARIAPVWVLPDEGWHVGTRSTFERLRARYAEKGYLAGDHGYDPRLPTMGGILIAHGPMFRRGVEIPAVENIHLYNLMCAMLRLTPAKNDGDDRLVRTMLRE